MIILWPKKQKKIFKEGTNSELWQVENFDVLLKPFLTHEVCISNDFISIEKMASY